MANEWGSIDTSSKAGFLKLEEPTTRLRIASKPYVANIHWEEDINGVKKKIVCPDTGCPLCLLKRKEHLPLTRFYAKVINRNDGQAYLFEFGKTIASAIKRYALSDQYGDPKMYDIKIDKTGSGRDSKYNVLASTNKSPLTELELQALAEIDIDSAIMPTPITEIKSMGLIALPLEVKGVSNDSFDAEITDDDWKNL